PKLSRNEEALELLLGACKNAHYQPGHDVFFALDVAANEIFDEQKQLYRINQDYLDRDALLDWYEGLTKSFPIISIEDPFHENDYAGFSKMTARLGSSLQIVGDDLFVTNERYI